MVTQTDSSGPVRGTPADPATHSAYPENAALSAPIQI